MIKRVRKTCYALLRLAMGVGITVWIFSRIDLADFREVLLDCLGRWPWLAAAVGAAGGILMLGALRWRLLLRACAVPLNFERLMRIYLIGHFFNAFMLGMAGGDLVRAFYTARAAGCRKTQALATVLMDRLSGMVVIYLLAGMMLAIHAELFMSHWAMHLPALIMLALIAAGIMLMLVLFNVHRFKHWRLFDAVRRRPRLTGVLQGLMAAVDIFRRRPGLVLQTSLLSLVAQMLLILQCYFLGRSLLIPLGFIDYLVVIPLINSIAAIPVTPGGLGVREALSVTMLGAMGVASARALPLSLMIYGVTLIWSMAGGLLFMIYSSGSGHTMREEVAELRGEVAGENGQAGIAGAHQQ